VTGKGARWGEGVGSGVWGVGWRGSVAQKSIFPGAFHYSGDYIIEAGWRNS